VQWVVGQEWRQERLRDTPAGVTRERYGWAVEAGAPGFSPARGAADGRRRKRARRERPRSAEGVAAVLAAEGDLLRVHRRRLPREDLEDCLGQAVLELVGRRGPTGSPTRHIDNALEKKLLSRVTDRQRWLSSRARVFGPHDEATGATAGLVSDDGALDIPAADAGPAEAVGDREDLRRHHEVAAELPDEERPVLACQVSLGMGTREFCERFRWTPAKFRRVASGPAPVCAH
jgi:hypothetical protein